MKIALLAPIEERVPPSGYGGVETVVHTLVEELHRRGHEVTLLASGDSQVSCRLIPIRETASGSALPKRLREAYTYTSLITAAKLLQNEQFDVLHNHIGWQALLFKDLFHLPVVTTIHWVLDNACERAMYEMHKEMPFVSISDSQREPLPDLNYVERVHHGLDLARFPYSEKPGGYLAFLGRFSPVKGPLEAIQIAKRTGSRLIMAAKINSFERDYYEQQIKPHIDGKQISFIGEIGHSRKIQLLSGASALLSPIQWNEPFGLTNIEAMACGTPVIAMRRGALPETIVHGKTGFLCDTVEQMVKHVADITKLNRRDSRDHIEANFSVKRMADQYLKVYRKVIRTHKTAVLAQIQASSAAKLVLA